MRHHHDEAGAALDQAAAYGVEHVAVEKLSQHLDAPGGCELLRERYELGTHAGALARINSNVEWWRADGDQHLLVYMEELDGCVAPMSEGEREWNRALRERGPSSGTAIRFCVSAPPISGELVRSDRRMRVHAEGNVKAG